eukprot:1212895-Amphidinium_carterae.3
MCPCTKASRWHLPAYNEYSSLFKNVPPNGMALSDDPWAEECIMCSRTIRIHVTRMALILEPLCATSRLVLLKLFLLLGVQWGLAPACFFLKDIVTTRLPIGRKLSSVGSVDPFGPHVLNGMALSSWASRHLPDHHFGFLKDGCEIRKNQPARMEGQVKYVLMHRDNATEWR